MSKIKSLILTGAMVGSLAVGTTASAQGVQGWGSNNGKQNHFVTTQSKKNDKNKFGDFDPFHFNFGQSFKGFDNFFKHFHFPKPPKHHHVGPPGGSVNPW
jgi:hypothetical protein